MIITFNTVQRTVIPILLCVISFNLFGQSFSHPGILNSRAELDFVKSKIIAGEEPWKSSFDTLKESNYSSLTYIYKPISVVECGSYNKPNIGCNDIVDDGMAVYSLALMWYFTGDQRYAGKAIEIITAWSDIYQQNINSNARLVVSWATPWYVNGAEILRYTNAGFSETHLAKFNGLLDKFLPYTLDDSMPGNNWVQSAIEAQIAIAVFKDDRSLFNQAVDRWKQRVKTYIYLKSDGPFPLSFKSNSESYVQNIWRSSCPGTGYMDGLCMETCRDLGHLGLGFGSMMYAAETAWQQGVDLFEPEIERITKFLELHAGWMTGVVAVPENICMGKVLARLNDKEGIAPPKGGGGKAWEIAYNHFHNRLGIELPYTSDLLLKRRPALAGHWVAKWETLTHGNLPFNLSNKK